MADDQDESGLADRSDAATIFLHFIDKYWHAATGGEPRWRGPAGGGRGRSREYAPVASLAAQRVVLSLHLGDDRPLEPRELRYLVDAGWWERWRDHLGHWPDVLSPGPIDNAPLLEPAEPTRAGVHGGGRCVLPPRSTG